MRGGLIRRAFLYSNGQLLDLKDLIDPALGLTLFQAVAINDNGQIVANGSTPAGGYYSYLLTPAASPVPEPGSLTLLGLFVGLSYRFIRRTKLNSNSTHDRAQ